MTVFPGSWGPKFLPRNQREQDCQPDLAPRLVRLFFLNGVSSTWSIQKNAIHYVNGMASYAVTLFASSFAHRSAGWILGAALALNGYSWATPPETSRSSAAEAHVNAPLRWPNIEVR